MKKSIFILFIVFGVFTFNPKADAFLDVFTIYSKRTNQINEVLLEALSDSNASWKRLAVPFVGKYENSSIYLPSHSSYQNTKKEFIFAEKKHAKHPTLHALNDFFEDEKTSAAKATTASVINEESPSKCTEIQFVKSINLLSKNENSISYELTSVLKKREGMTTQSTNFMGGSTKKHVFSEEPKENLKEYDLTWIVDLGNRNFRTYTFKSKDTIPTPEEKKYLIDLFEYMEAKIQNVQS